MLKVKVTSIGNSMGIILPRAALGKMKIAKGDSLYLLEGIDSCFLTSYQEVSDKQIEISEKVMNKYCNALHELSK